MADKFAIVNGIGTTHKVRAICEVWTYDVWGNARDGFEVNDRSCAARAMPLTCTLEISNVPAFPGAKDAHREFPASSSFNAEVMVSYTLGEKELREALGIGANVRLEIDGDGETYYVNRARDSYPIGEVYIDRWEALDNAE